MGKMRYLVLLLVTLLYFILQFQTIFIDRKTKTKYVILNVLYPAVNAKSIKNNFLTNVDV